MVKEIADEASDSAAGVRGDAATEPSHVPSRTEPTPGGSALPGPEPEESRAEDATMARVAARAAGSQARGRGRGRRGGRGRGRGADAEVECASEPCAANAPADAIPSGTAALRRVAAAEEGLRVGLAFLDGIDLEATLRSRVLTLQGLELISERTSPQLELRGWKLFLFAPRMLLHRTAGATRVAPGELARRCEAFARGEWPALLQPASRTAACPQKAARHVAPDPEARAARAAALVHLGELSAAGRALVAEPLAPATDATLAELRDPQRRPPEPYDPMPSKIANFAPHEPCPLSAFLACLRTARRGAAAGPSGATAEHLRILLDDEVDSQQLHCAAQRLAQADVPDAALAAIRVGRIVALQKPDGRGIRALVVGDVLRRLVGRTLAQAFAPHLERACLPHQYGLSTRAGSEALPHPSACPAGCHGGRPACNHLVCGRQWRLRPRVPAGHAAGPPRAA